MNGDFFRSLVFATVAHSAPSLGSVDSEEECRRALTHRTRRVRKRLSWGWSVAYGTERFAQVHGCVGASAATLTVNAPPAGSGVHRPLPLTLEPAATAWVRAKAKAKVRVRAKAKVRAKVGLGLGLGLA